MSALSREKMCSDSLEMREMAARICRDYLHGPWKLVTAQDIGFKRISGGLSNWLYHVWIPTHSNTSTPPTPPRNCSIGGADSDSEPNQVLLRIYGEVHGERALESLITESVIFTLLSERKLGPKLHGVFPGGRLEQYINARPLLTDELSKPELSVQIARKMAAIHTMEVPISKEPYWLWHTSERWLNTVESNLKKIDEDCEHKDLITKVKNYNLRKEITWLKNYLSKIDSPVVFCHNDMQEGNILMCQDDDEKNRLVLIDFEYCSYNYRGFDMANHFLEWTYDYSRPDYPYFYEYQDKYPTQEQQLLFLSEYLRTSQNGSNVSTVLNEIRSFTLASHMFWGLWACASAPLSQIPFGYWDYAIARFEGYFRQKSKLLACSQPTAVKRRLHEID